MGPVLHKIGPLLFGKILLFERTSEYFCGLNDNKPSTEKRGGGNFNMEAIGKSSIMLINYSIKEI